MPNFNSQIHVWRGQLFPIQSRDNFVNLIQTPKEVDDIKNEPMFFSSDLSFCYNYGGPLTRRFLESLPHDWVNDPSLIIDSRSHMLMEGWYPCIPGFHHDDVPREREDGQPEYGNPSYKAEHVMALVGDCSVTEFAVGEAEFPEVALGYTCYKVWHPMVVEKIKSGILESIKCPIGRLVYFNWNTWHQGTKAIKSGWRWFARASKNTKRKHANEIRRQVQVYLEFPMEGW